MYELLGDDLVIFDKKASDQYLSIMSSIGVSINMTKSIIAPNRPVFEFAKVTGYYGEDVSPISWRLIISQNSWIGRVNIAHHIMGRSITLPSPVTYLKNFFRKSKYQVGSTDFSFHAL
jgi:hypothetical protein